MVDERMQYGSRRICEFLQANPGSTRRQIAEGLGSLYVTVKKTLGQLERNGYVQQAGGYGAAFTLTGKPFPPSAACVQRPKVQAEARMAAPGRIRRDPLERIVYDMVLMGRGAFGHGAGHEANSNGGRA